MTAAGRYTAPARSARFWLAAGVLLGAGCAPWNAEEGGVGADGKADLFGEDSRQDWYQVSPDWFASGVGMSWRQVFDSVVSLTRDERIMDGTLPTLEEQGICPDEPFAQQPAAKGCSGLLLSEWYVLSAGHCFARVTDPGEILVVFNHRMESEQSSAPIEPERDVYRVEELAVLAGGDSRFLDYAVLRLDRPAQHPPYPWVRWDEPAHPGEDLIIVGHPAGVPAKLARGRVRSERRSPSQVSFQHDLDSLRGNSGSPIFDQEGYWVGMHKDGATSEGTTYRLDPDRGCKVARPKEHAIPWNLAIDAQRILEDACRELGDLPALCPIR